MSALGSALFDDGVYVNVNGQTGELITDPNTGELKVSIGSNQPIGGGAGGTTAAASSQVGANLGTSLSNALAGQLFGVPIWIFGLFLLILVLGVGFRSFRR